MQGSTRALTPDEQRAAQAIRTQHNAKTEAARDGVTVTPDFEQAIREQDRLVEAKLRAARWTDEAR
jgi:hypothetical protein